MSHQRSRLAIAGLLLLSPTLHAQSTATALNPKISLILQGVYADYSADTPADMDGFLLGPETELHAEGFGIAESELVLEANVDDAWHAFAAIALENEDGETVVAVEEAYANTLALPHGVAFKLGRFFSDIGYMNRQHTHAWEFVDAPLVYRAFFANQYKDDGVQLRWIAPTDFLLELGVEGMRGAGFPSGGDDRSALNATTAFAHVGADINQSLSYRLGASFLAADSDARVTEDEDEDTGEAFTFTGDTDIVGLDFVLKWAPQGNPKYRNAVFQAEVFQRDEGGQLDFVDGAGTTASTNYDGEAWGAYVQGVWQFMPAWRVGARYDRLNADNSVDNNPGGEFDLLAAATDDPERWSAMVDYSRSEFSRLRLQYSRDSSRSMGGSDDQLFLQYIFSIGAHPAHMF